MAGTGKATWAGCLKLSAVASLDALRLRRDIEGCVAGDFLWIRGEPNEALQKEMRSIPWQRSYEVLPGGKLRARGSLLPDGRLPGGDWFPLKDLLKAVMPIPILPGQRPERMELCWSVAEQERPPALLLTTAEHWLAFVSEASALRLRPLVFVQNSWGDVVVKGTPLPSIPGSYFSMENGIALPAGREILPRLSAQTLRVVLGLAEDEIALLLEDGTFSGIPGEAWLPADRSLVRMNSGTQSYGTA